MLLVLTFIKEALIKSESGTPSREERWTLEWSSDGEKQHKHEAGSAQYGTRRPCARCQIEITGKCLPDV